MKHEAFHNSFLEEIAQKIPQKTKLADILADMLCIGKDAVYRRLRGDMPFTFDEAMTVSRQLGISLDNLNTDISVSKPFKLNLIEYINPAESDFALMEEMTMIMKSFKGIPNPEVGEITNILPQPLYVVHENIFRFYLFKWKYQTNRFSRAVPYKDILILNKLKKIQEEYAKWAKQLDTEYVFDYQLFNYIITDIRYFYNIDLISREDIQLIQEDLLKILDKIDTWSRTGIIEESGKKIDIYISNVNIDTNYIYVSTPDYQLTIIKAFILNGIASTDKATFKEVKYWIRSMKQQSTLITKSSETERILFLKEQRELIQSLYNL